MQVGLLWIWLTGPTRTAGAAIIGGLQTHASADYPQIEEHSSDSGETARPDYVGLAEVLTRAFGVPAVQTEVLRDVSGITAGYIYGSWAARHADLRPVGDIDVLVLGDPDRDQLYAPLG